MEVNVPQLIHHMYTPLSEVIANYDARCSAMGINPKKFVWDGSPHPRLFSDDRGEAVVLDRSFSTLNVEILFTWSWAAEQQNKSWWSEFMTDPERLFLCGNVEYPSWRQRWVRIRRTANYGQSPENVLKDGRQMPGREIISMLAQHPEVARRMNGSAEHPFLWMAGLECKVSGGKPRLVPSAWVDTDDREFGVGAGDRGTAYRSCAVPEFVEE